jgi:leucyl-tRNA synthetase
LSLEKENPLIHQTIKKVSHDIEKLRFNTAIACLMEFLNTVREQENPLTKKEWEKFLILLSPFAPFFAEEQWHKIYPEKENQSIFAKAWPDFDLNLAQKQEIELVIQINGKVRDKILMAPKVSESVVQKTVLAREKIKTYLKGKKIKKIIFVPDKLINLVVE